MNGVILNGGVDSQKFVQESDVYLTIFAREHPNSKFLKLLGKDCFPPNGATPGGWGGKAADHPNGQPA